MRNHIQLIILSSFLLFALNSRGTGFELKVKLPSVANGEVILTHYYASNILVYDTIRLDAAGNGVLARDTLLPEGIYKMYLNQDNHFDFLLGAEQKVSLASPDFNQANVRVEGAKESVEFMNYLTWITGLQEKRMALEKQRGESTGEERATIEKQLGELNEQVHAYWKGKYEEYPGSFLGTFLMSNYFSELREEDIPAEHKANDSLKWVYQYNYVKNHYFEYYDLTDERMLFTPSIKQKVEAYFERVLLQMYDSVKPAAYEIIEKVEPHPRMYRFVVSHLLNSSLNSKIMGMDALFVDIAKDYYLSGKAVWADPSTLEKIRENVLFLENNLVGRNARDFQMETDKGDPFRLYQLPAKFTVLVFYEPNCSHCREYVPQLYKDVYLPFRDQGLDVVAVYTMENKNEWVEFLEKHQLYEWHNVWDQHHLTRFKIVYDTRTTPSVYLLDKDKKIIAKRFTIDFLKEYLPQNL